MERLTIYRFAVKMNGEVVDFCNFSTECSKIRLLNALTLSEEPLIKFWLPYLTDHPNSQLRRRSDWAWELVAEILPTEDDPNHYEVSARPAKDLKPV